MLDLRFNNFTGYIFGYFYSFSDSATLGNNQVLASRFIGSLTPELRIKQGLTPELLT